MANNEAPEFIKYPKIGYLEETPDILDNEVEAYEKLDGGNVQVRTWQGRILCGNRTKFITERSHPHYWFPEFYRWAQRNISLLNLDENFVLFGEWMSPHTLEYDSEFQNSFFLHDIFDTDTGLFLPYAQNACDIAEYYGLNGIHIHDPVLRGRVSLAELEREAAKKSPYGAKKREGLVVKDYGIEDGKQVRPQRMAKLVNPEFKDMNYAAFLDENASVEDIARACVNYPRIKKAIETIRSEGNRYEPGKDAKDLVIITLAADIRDEFSKYRSIRNTGNSSDALDALYKEIRKVLYKDPKYAPAFNNRKGKHSREEMNRPLQKY